MFAPVVVFLVLLHLLPSGFVHSAGVRPAFTSVTKPSDCAPKATTSAAECSIKSEKCLRRFGISMSFFYGGCPGLAQPMTGCQCADRCNLGPGPCPYDPFWIYSCKANPATQSNCPPGDLCSNGCLDFQPKNNYCVAQYANGVTSSSNGYCIGFLQPEADRGTCPGSGCNSNTDCANSYPGTVCVWTGGCQPTSHCCFPCDGVFP